MAKGKEEKREESGNLATSKQKELITQLYQETGYKRQYNKIELDGIYNTEAQKHIDFLIGYKRAQQNGNVHKEYPTGFNKIEFGMIYKLCWRYCGEHKGFREMDEEAFKKMVCMEYIHYKNAMAYTKKAVEKKAGA